ncbi:MAG: endonuclease III [Candidatus Omnitrophica bacterium]|nr:endonuclease III [Candidatus Omnitrophota bacterium]
MAHRGGAELKARVRTVVLRLTKAYPRAHCTLDYRNPLELMVATILSAQCTDERVNKVTPALFKKYRSAQDYAAALPAELEKDIRSTGFYRSKAKSIRLACSDIAKKYAGRIPDQLGDLVELHGIGRKTANVILGNAYGIPGMVVDTHVKRLANRLGFTQHKDPVKIEFDLMQLIPKERWTQFSHVLIQHGRRCCTARRPDCPHCPVGKWCPSNGKV